MVDLAEIVERHAGLVADILSHSTGPLGELLVARKLGSLGCEVSILRNNAKQRDLNVVLPDRSVVGIEVKAVQTPSRTKRDGRVPSVTWWVNSPPDLSRSKFWIFVVIMCERGRIPDESEVAFYVLTVPEVQSVWKRDDMRRIGDVTSGRLAKLGLGVEGGFAKMGLALS